MACVGPRGEKSCRNGLCKLSLVRDALIPAHMSCYEALSREHGQTFGPSFTRYLPTVDRFIHVAIVRKRTKAGRVPRKDLSEATMNFRPIRS